jgi:hypothetical protein
LHAFARYLLPTVRRELTVYLGEPYAGACRQEQQPDHFGDLFHPKSATGDASARTGPAFASANPDDLLTLSAFAMRFGLWPVVAKHRCRAIARR